ncbi:MAG TPA: septal ring lytic transglycosylase RlpA family protein [Caulobacteraceae bacterium]|nr:septal ring lytic transglycosylase RlpA family protein [Caulobacteraceae bacterium]
MPRASQGQPAGRLSILCAILTLALASGFASQAAAQSKPFAKTGAASWYGQAFQGRKTASGERFDMREMTAAHRTLPFGTRLEVTNLANGRTVVVRVNDRGPFSGGRILDLSHAAAEKLGFVDQGAAKVAVRLLGEEVGEDDRLYTVEAGEYPAREAAELAAERLGDDPVAVTPVAAEGAEAYRVNLGPWPSREEAEAALKRAVHKGFERARVAPAVF